MNPEDVSLFIGNKKEGSIKKKAGHISPDAISSKDNRSKQLRYDRDYFQKHIIYVTSLFLIDLTPSVANRNSYNNS